jgi:hypothetical protein
MLGTHWEQGGNVMRTHWEQTKIQHPTFLQEKENVGPMGACSLTSLATRFFYLPTCVLCHFGHTQIGKGMNHGCIGLGKEDSVFRFILEYSSLRDFGP